MPALYFLLLIKRFISELHEAISEFRDSEEDSEHTATFIFKAE
jgi:hypothetical protein